MLLPLGTQDQIKSPETDVGVGLPAMGRVVPCDVTTAIAARCGAPEGGKETSGGDKEGGEGREKGRVRLSVQE